MITLVILAFILIMLIGFISILNRSRNYKKDIAFAIEYRETFVAFSNLYYSTYERFYRNGTFDSVKYIWLTKNVNRIQGDLGQLGVMEYIGPFQRFQVKNYQIIVNSLPKFRDGSIEKFDANSVDDCLIRYIGTLEDLINRVAGKIRNPIIWFKEGFLELISLPLYLFNWFGILSNNAILKVKSSLIYKIIVGIGSLITFLSGVVTIILGKEETIKFINNLFK